MELAVGIDLGGTKIDVGIVAASGKVLKRVLIETVVDKGPQAIISEIIALVRTLQEGAGSQRVTSVGVGIAGQVEKRTGLVHFAPNLNWRDFPLGEELIRALKLPVAVTNDVRAATLAERLYGAGQGCDELICLFVGTGIGGGIVSGGKLIAGSSNTAGELGHITIDLHGPPCSCGNYGCFEALAGGWAIAKSARERIVNNPKEGAALLELAGGMIDAVTAQHVFAGADKGILSAKVIVDEVKDALIAGVATLINAFNPSRLVLGGGIMQGRRELIEAIRRGVPLRALKTPLASLQIVEAQLGAEAGVIGAAAFSRQGGW